MKLDNKTRSVERITRTNNSELLMTNAIKIRLRAAEREIEIEASRADVDALLNRWWAQSFSSTDEEDSLAEGSGSLGRRK